MYLRITLLSIWLTGTFLSARAQVPTCGANVPYYNVNLIGQPAGNWTSPAHSRDGQCCGAPSSDNCTSFEVILDPGAAMINLEIVSGNLPTGALYYQINCGPAIFVGQPVCVVGGGPFNITFCKPGNNQNGYKITSIPKPTFPADATVRLGCTKILNTLGFQSSSVTWNSIFPGAAGTYNSYLSCTNCTDPVYTPDGSAPAFIDYRICGTPTASSCGFVAVCDTVRIYNVGTMSASVAPANAGFCAGGSVTLTANASGGSPPYTYIWKDQSNNQVGTGSTYVAGTAGIYTLETRDAVYDPTTCPPLLISVPVVVTQPPTVNAGLDQTVCTGLPTAYLSGSITNATGGTWSGGAGTFSPNANTLTASYTPTAGEIAAGFASLTLTSTGAGGGCVDASDVVQITYPPLLSVSLSDQSLSCNSSTVTLSPIVGGGTPAYTYAWSNNSANSTITVGAGNYCVTVADARGCTQSVCANVTVPPTLGLIVTSTDATTIGGTDGTATATPSGGTPPYTYTWTPTAQTTQTATGLSYGIYSVVVTDANSCSLPGSVVVNDPICNNLSASISAQTNILCHGSLTGSATVSAAGGPSGVYTYSWNTSPPQITATATGLGAGTYLATVYDGSCQDIVSVVISEPAQITNSMNHTNCSIVGGNDGSATSNPSGGNGAYTYSWSNSATTQGISNLTGGTYTVTIRDANNCSYIDSVRITEPPCNNIVLNVSAVNVSCFGGNNGSATAQLLFGNPPYTYSWNTTPAQTTQTATGLSQGTYVVVVRDAQNCLDFKLITITEPSPLSLGLVKTDVICSTDNNGTIDLTVSGGTFPYSYVWSNGIQVEDQVYLSNGTYSVTVTDSKGCTKGGSTTITRPSLIIASSSKSDVTCFGGTDGSVNATISGGVVPYTYSWSNSATTEDISGLVSGQYILGLTDANTCNNPTTLNIIIDQPTIVDVSQFIISCPVPNSGVSNVFVVPSGGNGPYQISFDNGSTYGTVGNYSKNLAVGNTYTVFVKDINNCLSLPKTLVINPAVTISAISYVKCLPVGVNTTTVTVTPAGGAGVWWQISSDNGSTFLPAGTYTTALTVGNTYFFMVEDSLGCTSPVTSLVIPDTIKLTSTQSSYAGGYNVSCNGLSNGSINLAVSGGTSAYTYSWNSGQTTEDISNISAGNYSVTATDANTCTKVLPITLTEPNILASTSSVTTNFNGSSVSCNGSTNGAVDLSVNGGTTNYTYAWSNSQTTQDISNLGSGTYSVTITDANSCTTTTAVTLTQPAVLINSGVKSNYNGQNISCNGLSDGSVDLSVVGGTTNYTYAWSNSETTEDITGLTFGTYTVLVTDVNGCTATNSFTLSQPAILTSTINVSSDYNGQDISCNGLSNGSIGLNVAGGTTNYTYTWSNSQTTQNISGLNANTYSVLVTDVNGCTNTNSITVTEPTLLTNTIAIASNYNGQNISCIGKNDGAIDLTVGGGTTGYTYSWTNTLQTTEDISGLSANTYSIMITDANGCTSTNSITLLDPPMLTNTITVSSNYNFQNISCNGASDGSIDLNVAGGTPGYTYSWSNSATTEDISGLSANVYAVLITDVNGCTSTNTMTVTEPAALSTSAAISSNYNSQNISCNGAGDGAIDLSVTGGTVNYTFSWSNASTTEDITGLSANTYSVLVTDVNGCSSTNSITLNQPAVLSSIVTINSNVNCTGGNNGSANANPSGGTSPYTYSWSNGQTTSTATGLTASMYSVTVTDVNGCTAANVFSITQPAVLTNTIAVSSDYNGQNISCSGISDGAIDLSVAGGTINYTYAWNNAQTTQDISGLSAGTYSVLVTDAKGCTSSNTVTLTQPAVLTNTIAVSSNYNGQNISCNGLSDGAIDLSVAGGTTNYTYSWSNALTTQDISSLAAGTYSVLITDVNGCTSAGSITLAEPAVLADTILSTPVLCNGGNTGTASVTVNGGTLPYTYLWSNSQTTAPASGLAQGTYSVTITDANGCSNLDSAMINQPTALASSTAVTDVLCNGGNTGTASASISGGMTPYTYSWSNGNTNATTNGLSAGTYYITSTDSNGCSVLDSVIVNQPLVLSNTISTTNALCNGDSSATASLFVSGGMTPYSYLWTNGDSTSSITGLSAGSYSVTVTDSNGCSMLVPFSISQPTALTHVMSSVGASCNAGSDGSATATVIGGTSPYAYNWTPTSQTTSTATGLSVGNYFVSVVDSNGCSFSDSISVTENSPVVLSFNSQNVSCYGNANGMIDLSVAGGMGPYSYIWSTGDTLEDLSNLGDGTYIVAVLDANQCGKSDTIILTQPDSMSVSLTSTIHNGGYNISVYQGANGDISSAVSGGTPPYTYFWTNGATDQNLAGLTAGTYTVEVTDSLGCKMTATINLTEPFEFAMPGGISPNDDGLNDFFVIHGLDIFTDNSLQVFNRWGDEVYSASPYLNDWGGTYKGGGLLPDGTYFVILKVTAANDEVKTLTGFVDIRK